MSTKSPDGFDTIPTTFTTVTPPSKPSDLPFLSTPRPWHSLLSLSLPLSYPDAISRVKLNLSHFCSNYIIITLLILFLSLLLHPLSMLLFHLLSVAWFFLYFSRHGPVMACGHALDDRVVLCGLGMVTVMAIVVMHVVAVNVVVGLVVAAVVVGFHALFRGTEDLFLDEESASICGLLSVAGSDENVGYARI